MLCANPYDTCFDQIKTYKFKYNPLMAQYEVTVMTSICSVLKQRQTNLHHIYYSILEHDLYLRIKSK